jgi:cytochrome c553
MRLVIAALTAGIAASVAAAPPPGATTCSGCHAAAEGGMPRLDRLTAEEITAAMAGFRAGTRPATLMDRIARGFSEAEAEAIAAWLVAQR